MLRLWGQISIFWMMQSKKLLLSRSLLHYFPMSSNDNNIDVNNVVTQQPNIQQINGMIDTSIIIQKQRKCGFCRQTGHDKRNCSQLLQAGEFHANIDDQCNESA